MERRLYKEEVDITGGRALTYLLPPQDEPNLQSTAVIGQQFCDTAKHLGTP